MSVKSKVLEEEFKDTGKAWFQYGKKCAKCGNIKPRSEFNYCEAHHDKLQSYCKKCTKEYHRNLKSVKRPETSITSNKVSVDKLRKAMMKLLFPKCNRILMISGRGNLTMKGFYNELEDAVEDFNNMPPDMKLSSIEKNSKGAYTLRVIMKV